MLAGYWLFTSGVLMIIVIIKCNFKKIDGVTCKELIMYDEQYESELYPIWYTVRRVGPLAK